MCQALVSAFLLLPRCDNRNANNDECRIARSQLSAEHEHFRWARLRQRELLECANTQTSP
jgi:hypothetical protein